MQLNHSHLKILKLKIYSSSLFLVIFFVPMLHDDKNLLPYSHSRFFFPFLSQSEIPNFCCWFLWKAPWTDQRCERASLFKKKKNVKQGNFVPGIKSIYMNNLIISIMLIWYLPILNLLSFFLFLFWYIQGIFCKWCRFCYSVLYDNNTSYLTSQNKFLRTCSKNIGRIVNIPIVSYFFVIRFVSITYWKSFKAFKWMKNW